MKQKIMPFFVYVLSCIIIFIAFLFFYNKNSSTASNTLQKNDEILVKFKASDEINVVKLADIDKYNEVLYFYNNHEAVEYAEPNFLYQASLIPSDTYYNNQWYLQKIKAVEAWDIVRESPDITIAIIDSGIDTDHPDLKDNIWTNLDEVPGNNIDDDKNGFIDDINGWDFVNNLPDPNPKFGEGFTEAGVFHGTIVAGIAAASGNNAAGISGITWSAKIMPLKVLDDKGEGDTGKVIKAIDYAINNGAHIINLSFVGFGFSQALDNAIKRAHEAGIIIVAAAGNEQGEGAGYNLNESPMYPACHDGPDGENWVIGVAATDTLDGKAEFSSYGTKCVDIAAPGISIYSTVVYSPGHYINESPLNKYYDGYWAGTSMATPMVSAAAALVEQANPQFSLDQVVASLLNNADNINRLNQNYINQLGRGRINIYRAVSQAKNTLSDFKTNILASPYSGKESLIKIIDNKGVKLADFLAYGENFLGGASIANCDVDFDGEDEIITAAGPGGGPHVRIFDQQGNVKGQFFAFEAAFRGGVNIDCADVDNDGFNEIIAAPASNHAPIVKIFSQYGDLKGSFIAYGLNFRGGVYAAAGDVDDDGIIEIVTGTGRGGGPHVRIFHPNGEAKGQFFAYNPKFRGGVRIAVADIDGGTRDKQAEIITAAGPGGGPHVRVFTNNGDIKAQFFAYNPKFAGGVNISAGDVDNDGYAEIITGAGESGGPHVRVFRTNASIISSFYAYSADFTGGVNVNIIKAKN